MALTYNEDTDSYESDSSADVKSPFSELLTAERIPVVSLVSTDPLSMLRDYQELTGSATISHVVDEYRCNAPGVGDSARLESAAVGRYLAGFSSEVGIGVRLESRAAGGQVEWGAFDGTDGFRFRLEDGGLFAEIVRDGVVTTSVERADWSVDKLDGNGPSGLDVEDIEAYVEEGHIWQVRWTWYGYGAIEWRLVARASGGRPQEVWTVHRAEEQGSTSVRQPHLPIHLRAWDGVDCYVGGRQYAILGGESYTVARTVGDYRLDQTIQNGAWTPIMAIRRDAAKPWSRGVAITIDEAGLLTTGELLTQFFLAPRGAVTSGTWGTVRDTPVDESAVQVNRTATTVNLASAIPLGPRKIVASGQGGQAQGSGEAATDRRTSIPRDLELILVARGIANAPVVDATMSWLETR